MLNFLDDIILIIEEIGMLNYIFVESQYLDL